MVFGCWRKRAEQACVRRTAFSLNWEENAEKVSDTIRCRKKNRIRISFRTMNLLHVSNEMEDAAQGVFCQAGNYRSCFIVNISPEGGGR